MRTKLPSINKEPKERLVSVSYRKHRTGIATAVDGITISLDGSEDVLERFLVPKPKYRNCALYIVGREEGNG